MALGRKREVYPSQHNPGLYRAVPGGSWLVLYDAIGNKSG